MRRHPWQCLQSPFESPEVQLILVTTLFTLVALDVNFSDSLHLLQPADNFVHSSVAAMVPWDVRLFANKAISNTPIMASALASLVCLAGITWKRPKEGATVFAVMAFMNSVGAPAFTAVYTCVEQHDPSPSPSQRMPHVLGVHPTTSRTPAHTHDIEVSARCSRGHLLPFGRQAHVGVEAHV